MSAFSLADILFSDGKDMSYIGQHISSLVFFCGEEGRRGKKRRGGKEREKRGEEVDVEEGRRTIPSQFSNLCLNGGGGGGK